MSDIKDLTNKINQWVVERGWEPAQKPKDLAISLSLEAAEVLEHFQWKNERKVAKHIKENKDELADELADVAIYLFKLADKTKIDLKSAVENKLVKASKKYPVEAVKGNSKEYYRLKKQARAK
ncbi:nucleotide pyrophosphohydrolase [Candidatus Microgenomates bacterium]|nr:MAG: nucleotide pyrophosphohydrolase [Candidatus Microgenomates bacterium]